MWCAIDGHGESRATERPESSTFDVGDGGHAAKHLWPRGGSVAGSIRGMWARASRLQMRYERWRELKAAAAATGVEIMCFVDLADVTAQHLGEPASFKGAIGDGSVDGGIVSSLLLVAA